MKCARGLEDMIQEKTRQRIETRSAANEVQAISQQFAKRLAKSLRAGPLAN
jgi:hypothetical protein